MCVCDKAPVVGYMSGDAGAHPECEVVQPMTPLSWCTALGMVEPELVGLLGKALAVWCNGCCDHPVMSDFHAMTGYTHVLCVCAAHFAVRHETGCPSDWLSVWFTMTVCHSQVHPESVHIPTRRQRLSEAGVRQPHHIARLSGHDELWVTGTCLKFLRAKIDITKSSLCAQKSRLVMRAGWQATLSTTLCSVSSASHAERDWLFSCCMYGAESCSFHS